MPVSADITRLMNDMRLRLPGALDNVIQQEMFAAINEFFQESNVWRQDVPFSTVAGTDTYPITPTGVAAINRLMWVYDTTNWNNNNGTASAYNCPAVAATMATPGTIVLDVAPSTVRSLVATVGLTLADPADSNNYPQFPTWIMSKYRSDFFDGVLGRMMSQPAKPYSNQQLAVYHLRRWRGAISKARVETRRKNSYGLQAWRFPQAGARVSSQRR